MFKLVKSVFTVIGTVLGAIFGGFTAALGAMVIVSALIFKLRLMMGFGALLGTSLFVSKSIVVVAGVAVGCIVAYALTKLMQTIHNRAVKDTKKNFNNVKSIYEAKRSTKAPECSTSS
jgi:hypothetical protein